MSEPAPPRSRRSASRRSTAVWALAVGGLLTWAVSARLVSTLTAEQEVWVARQTSGRELVWTVLLVTLALPAILALAAGWSLARKRIAARLPGLAVLALLCLLAAAGILKPFGGSDSKTLVVLAGIALASALLLLPAARFLFGVIALGAPVLAVYVLLQPNARGILAGERTPAGPESVVTDPAPVVVVIFDALPMYLLLDEHGGIDSRRFPNFHRLASTSTWFRYATTVADATVPAVTSILTGRYPDPNHRLTALHGHYPFNLLTFLPPRFERNLFEQHTLLSPDSLQDDRDLAARIRENLQDFGLVYLHGVLPRDLAAYLPAVDETWRGFWLRQRSSPRTDRRDRDEARLRTWIEGQRGHFWREPAERFPPFFERLRSSGEASFHYYKSDLPHRPWRYLPSGRTYFGFDNKLAGETHQHLQRHLLQTMYVDALVGDLLDALEAAPWGRRALVVVTADHGVSFSRGRQHRRARKWNFSEILSVPLFVKLPDQTTGAVIDGSVETVDILPTILAVTGVEAPVELDGTNALAAGDDRSDHLFFDNTRPVRKRVEFAHRKLIRRRERVVREKLELLGPASGPFDLYRLGPRPEIVGRSLGEFSLSASCGSGAALANRAEIEAVDLQARQIPAYLRGTAAPGSAGTDLALAVNGTIAATTTVRGGPGRRTVFSAMIPELLLRQGDNQVVVLQIPPDDESALGICTG